jgi:hypothetical protein
MSRHGYVFVDDPLLARSYSDSVLATTYILGPCGLDVCQNSPNFLIAKRVLEPWHVTLVAGRGHGADALPDDLEKHLVRMMPCVTGSIMGRCWHPAVRLTLAPIRLPLEAGSVTRSTVSGIDGLAERHLGRIGGIGTLAARNQHPGRRAAGDDEYQRGTPDQR